MIPDNGWHDVQSINDRYARICSTHIIYKSNSLYPRIVKRIKQAIPDFDTKYRIKAPMTVNRYKSGGFITLHDDVGGDPTRVLSVSIQLSDESEYVGGHLVFPSLIHVADKEIGSGVAFDSKIKHEVLEVESGVRYSLVVWVHSK